ncbi:MAG: tRNA-dihydrouridine synthase, partial [Cyanobacteria bacterium HKST-UBA01]|nr:tRNA-dihydrouridine synthase [Cyanobacteria bacterium HKST-UBA01]
DGLREPWDLGGLRIPNRVVQAPLAGIGNRAFRLQAHRHGAGLVVSEMVASMGIHHGNRKTAGMLRIDPAEGVTAIQLFGADPSVMAEAARAAQDAGASAVDINMGCPVPKICKTGAGAALLADPVHAASIVRAMADAVRIPVMVKMRRGLTPDEARPVDLARRFEQAGAAALTVHPRAAAEEYAGTSDHRITGDVAAAVAIPVVASGDILTP